MGNSSSAPKLHRDRRPPGPFKGLMAGILPLTTVSRVFDLLKTKQDPQEREGIFAKLEEFVNHEETKKQALYQLAVPENCVELVMCSRICEENTTRMVSGTLSILFEMSVLHANVMKLVYIRGGLSRALMILSTYSKDLTTETDLKISAMRSALKLLKEFLQDDESLESMVQMRGWEVISEALKAHDWEPEVLEDVSRVAFFLGAHPVFERAQMKPLIELAIQLLETQKCFLLAAYRLIAHFTREHTAENAYKDNLDRVVVIISKRIPVATDPIEINEICHLTYALSRGRAIYLSEDAQFQVMEMFKPLLKRTEPANRTNATIVYTEFFNDISSIEIASKFLKHNLLEPLMIALAAEEDPTTIPFACTAVATLLVAVGPIDWHHVLVMPSLIKAICKMLTSPMTTPIFPAAIQITYAILKDGPRVMRRYLDSTALDATSTNPFVDYLYAAIGEKILAMRVTDPTHSSLLLLPVFEELVGMPVPHQQH